MTRRSPRELRRAIDALGSDTDDPPDPCPDCGGLPEGHDAAVGVTAEFVTYECTCGREPDTPDGYTVDREQSDGTTYHVVRPAAGEVDP